MAAEAARPLDPALFAPGPARDGRFEVKERWRDCCNLPAGHPEKEREFLHRQMNEEVDGLECAARLLLDFPAMDWDLQMQVARQCQDESRHVEMFRAAFERRGGRVGQYPVLNFQYRIITKVDDLCARLAIQNRAFETEGVDAVQTAMESARREGAGDLEQLYAAQLADEICHVRFANEYLMRAVAREPATVMRIGRALDRAAKAFLEVMGSEAIEGAQYPVNRKGRLEAGFSEAEVDVAEGLRAGRPAGAGGLPRRR